MQDFLNDCGRVDTYVKLDLKTLIIITFHVEKLYMNSTTFT